jgi:hypothetical protein
MKPCTAPCGLCLEDKLLLDSHLLPAALYKLCRNPKAKRNPNPIVVTHRKSVITSDQVKAPFLCASCESRLNENGEQYVLAQSVQPNGQFKLRKRLETSKPVYRDSRFRVYDIYPLLGEKIGHYLYFAASIFWRAAAHPWKVKTESIGPIAFDFNYLEEFRRYLLGKNIFPQDARVYVFVSSEVLPHRMVTVPTTDLDFPGRQYKFYIPSLCFVLYSGKDAEQRFGRYALNGSVWSYMWISPWQDNSLFHGCVLKSDR